MVSYKSSYNDDAEEDFPMGTEATSNGTHPFSGDFIDVLIIEDDPAYASIICEEIENHSEVECRTMVAGRLEEGCLIAHQHPVDIVFLDLNLPDCRGVETFERLQDEHPDLPVIVMSGLYDNNVAFHVLRSGAQEYLRKASFNKRGINQTMLHAIERHRFAIELRKQRQELARSETRVRRIIESGIDAILIIDKKGNVQFANYAASQMFNRPVEDLVSGAFGSPIIAGQSIEIDILRHNGEPGIAEMRAVSIEWNDRPAFLASLRDVTHRKRNEERIRRQATLLNVAKDAILEISVKGVINFWNQGAEAIYGWGSDEVTGKKLSDFFPEDEADYEEIIETLLKIREWRGELEQTRKDGKKITVESRWVLFKDDQGGTDSILCINSNITERKRLESQILRAQRMESIGTLASGIAHDLNNVLSPILMAVTIQKLKTTNEEDLHTLELMESSAKRGSLLIKQVLEFGRGIEGQRIPVQLSHIAYEIEQIVTDTFPKSIEFKIKMSRDLGTILGDPTQMHQVMLNLCVNARDAMPTGGVIQMTIDNVTLGENSADLPSEFSPGDYLVIRVSDTGFGIAPDVLDRIFEPFFTTKALGRGTGLGLSTVQTIVKSHGGFPSVQSETGKGTTFSIYLPAQHLEDEDREAFDKNDEIPRGNGELLLVVDDEEAIRTVAKNILAEWGYRVLLASNGAEAVALYTQNREKISVVITDMSMPVMGGTETIVALRSLDPNLKIIGSSGLPNPQNQADLQIQPTRFIAKPYVAEELLRTLKDIIPSGK